jgi:hypothetical protein
VATPGVTLDAGALVAAEQDSRQVWARLKAVRKNAAAITVPAPILAQVWRVPPHAEIARLLKACEIDELREAGAKAVGRLLGVSSTSDIADAAVVVGAVARGDTIMTSDPGDIQRLLEAAEGTNTIVAI